jgi:alpha-glucosidase
LTAPITPASVTYTRDLPCGIEVMAGSISMRVTAIRQDILRVRLCLRGNWPEDASWVVSKGTRGASVPVERRDSDSAVGFCTAALRVSIDNESARLVVTDPTGDVVSEDAPGWPVMFQNGGFSVCKAMPATQKMFGLGDKTGPLLRNDQSFSLWNTDPGIYQESSDPIYKSIPFVIGLRGLSTFGLFLDNTHRSWFDFGKRIRDVFSFGAEAGALDYYVMAGNNPKRVLSAYAHLTGRPPLPPLWALGHHVSKYGWQTAGEVLAVADGLRSAGFPSDALYLDIDFQDRMRPFTADPCRFPDLAAFVATLSAKGFRTVAISDPHLPVVSGEPTAYEPFVSGTEGDHFVRSPDDRPFVGDMWGGASVYPDFTRKRSRTWWGELYRAFVTDGIAGVWNDMNEPVVANGPCGTMPLDTVHRIEEPGFARRNASHAEIHNIYGMQNSRATYDGLLELRPDKRPFVLTRASFAGGHRYAATWTGDNTASWNHLRLGVAMMLNLGLSGFSMCGSDLGGFFGATSPELLTRWYQVGAFTPLFRNHCFKEAPAREPWLHGEPHTSIRRFFVEQRYRLLPYIYTLAEEASRTGLPLMRPLFLEFPGMAAIRPGPSRDPSMQFMLGAALMVAPPPFAEISGDYVVTFPGAPWFDWWTGLPIAATKVEPFRPVRFPVAPSIETLAVYVRGGSIIPLQPLVQSTQERPNGRLELRIYPGAKCRGTIYLDDGEGHTHRAGDYLRAGFTCVQDGPITRIGLSKREGRHIPWWSGFMLVLHDVGRKPESVTCSWGPVTALSYDPEGRILRITVADTVADGEVVVVAS